LEILLEANGVSTTVTRDVTLAPSAHNDVVWDVDVSSLTVQGTASMGGVPLTDSTLPAELRLLDSTDQQLGATTSLDLFTDDVGAYSFQVPIDSKARTAELTVHFDPDTTRVYRIGNLQPGAISRTLDLDPTFTLALNLHGHVVDDQGAPQVGYVDVSIIFIDVTGAVADATVTSSAALDDSGFYDLSVPLPEGMTHARVELSPNGTDEDWVVVVPLTGSAQAQTLDIDRQAPRIQLFGGVNYTDGCIPARVEPRLILIAFPSDPVGDYDPVTFDWPGGTRVYDSVVITDQNGRYGVAAALPPGTTRVAIITVDDQGMWTTSAVFTVDPTQVNMFGWDLLVC
jgi:hypothetical protein